MLKKKAVIYIYNYLGKFAELPTVPPLRVLTHLAGQLGVRDPRHQTPQNCCAPVQRAPPGPGPGRDASAMVRGS